MPGYQTKLSVYPYLHRHHCYRHLDILLHVTLQTEKRTRIAVEMTPSVFSLLELIQINTLTIFSVINYLILVL